MNCVKSTDESFECARKICCEHRWGKSRSIWLQNEEIMEREKMSICSKSDWGTTKSERR